MAHRAHPQAHARQLGQANGGAGVDGMRVTGETGVAIEGRYPGGLSGRAITRRDFDWLVESARDFLTRPGGWPETRYEAKARRKGHEVWYFRYRRV